MLAGEGDAQRSDRDIADHDLLRGHEGKRLVGYVRRRQAAEDLARCGSPQGKADVLPGDVFEADVEVAEAGLLAQPGQVVVAERRTGDHPELVVCKASDGEVGLDPAARVERLGVREVVDLAGHLVVADPLQEARSVRPAHRDLGEGGLVEQASGGPGRDVLGHRRRRPGETRPAVRPHRLVACVRRWSRSS